MAPPTRRTSHVRREKSVFGPQMHGRDGGLVIMWRECDFLGIKIENGARAVTERPILSHFKGFTKGATTKDDINTQNNTFNELNQ